MDESSSSISQQPEAQVPQRPLSGATTPTPSQVASGDTEPQFRDPLNNYLCSRDIFDLMVFQTNPNYRFSDAAIQFIQLDAMRMLENIIKQGINDMMQKKRYGLIDSPQQNDVSSSVENGMQDYNSQTDHIVYTLGTANVKKYIEKVWGYFV